MSCANLHLFHLGHSAQPGQQRAEHGERRHIGRFEQRGEQLAGLLTEEGDGSGGSIAGKWSLAVVPNEAARR
ncbi:MAG: hypothetical protein ACREHD_24255 [Pirellulales bacterium]